MNNYCTNCGKRLKKNEFICEKCASPIVDLSKKYRTPYQIKRRKKILKNIVISIISIIILLVLFFLIYYGKRLYLKNKYVEPFLKKKGEEQYKIKYKSSGKCIKTGNCKYDPMMGCDGGVCTPYVYFESNSCKAYYYSVTNEKKENSFYITVIKNKGKYYTIKGIHAKETSSGSIIENKK